jgi:hypothetical protein
VNESDNDTMMVTENRYLLARHLPNALQAFLNGH